MSEKTESRDQQPLAVARRPWRRPEVLEIPTGSTAAVSGAGVDMSTFS